MENPINMDDLGVPLFLETYQSLPFWELTYPICPSKGRWIFLFPFGGICDQKALKLQVDYVLNGFFFCKDSCFSKGLQSTISGNYSFSVLCLPGIRKDFGATHFLFQQKGRKQTPSPQESCKTITGLRISEWTRTQTKKVNDPVFRGWFFWISSFHQFLRSYHSQGGIVVQLYLFSSKFGWVDFHVVETSWVSWLVSWCRYPPRIEILGDSPSRSSLFMLVRLLEAVTSFTASIFRYDMWPTIWTHIFRYPKWRNPEPYGYFWGWVVYPYP